MRRLLPSLLLCTVAVGAIGVKHARADGGVVRLRAEDATTVATVFAPVDLRRDSAIDFTGLVQDRATSEVVLDAEVELQFTPPRGAPVPVLDPWCRPPRSTLLAASPGPSAALPPVPLLRGQAENRLLCGGSVIFPAAGEWKVRLVVRRGGVSLERETSVSVSEPSSRLSVVWPWLALPPVGMGLFALNQRLRLRRASAPS